MADEIVRDYNGPRCPSVGCAHRPGWLLDGVELTREWVDKLSALVHENVSKAAGEIPRYGRFDLTASQASAEHYARTAAHWGGLLLQRGARA